MSKIFALLFGKPEKAAFFRFSYYSGVVVYMILLFMSVNIFIMSGEWISSLIMLIIFPFAFRFTYWLNVKILKNIAKDMD